MAYSSPEKKRAYMKNYIARPGMTEKRRKNFLVWAEKNRPYLLKREKHRQLTKRAQCLVSYARKRSTEKGLPFDLDKHTPELQGRIDSGVCELTGLPFALRDGRQWNSPSIDRIRPELGYVISNIRIVVFALNVAMGNWGEDRLIQIVRAMESQRKLLADVE